MGDLAAERFLHSELGIKGKDCLFFSSSSVEILGVGLYTILDRSRFRFELSQRLETDLSIVDKGNPIGVYSLTHSRLVEHEIACLLGSNFNPMDWLVSENAAGLHRIGLAITGRADRLEVRDQKPI